MQRTITASYPTQELHHMAQDNEKRCTCETCRRMPPDLIQEWIDETRELIARVRTELDRQERLLEHLVEGLKREAF